MSYLPIKDVAYALRSYYPNADNTEKIILECALVGAGADAVGGIIPGLAIPATITACFGTVWVMYGRLAKELGISLKDNVLKLLARAALSNIAANLGGVLIGAFAAMFIPGGSILASAAIAFVTIYLAGLVFLKMILKLAQTSSDPYTFSDMNENTMKNAMNDMKVTKEDLKAAKNSYKENKK